MSELAGGDSYAALLPDLVITWGESRRRGCSASARRSTARSSDSGIGSGRSGNHVDDAWAILVPGTARASRARAAAADQGHRSHGLQPPRRRRRPGSRASRCSSARWPMEPSRARPRCRRPGASRRPRALARPPGTARTGVSRPCGRASGGRENSSRSSRRAGCGGSSAAACVPFYRERFRRGGSRAQRTSATIEDIGRLPILERADVERLGRHGTEDAPGAGACARPARDRSAGPFSSSGRSSRCAGSTPAKRAPAPGSARRSASGASRCAAGPVGTAQAISATLLNAEALHAPAVADRGRRSAPRPGRRGAAADARLGRLERALRGGARPARRRAHGAARSLLERRKSSASALRAALEEAFAVPACTSATRRWRRGSIAHECPEGGSLHVPAEGIVAEIVRPTGRRRRPARRATCSSPRSATPRRRSSGTASATGRSPPAEPAVRLRARAAGLRHGRGTHARLPPHRLG